MIKWDESLSTGVHMIDVQHKTIIEKFNEFEAASSDHEGRVAAGDILDFLQFYASWHFDREEKCMEEYNCPVAAVNKQAHQEFIETFNRFYQQWQEKDMDGDLVEKALQELENWIATHIRGVDTKLKACVKQ